MRPDLSKSIVIDFETETGDDLNLKKMSINEYVDDGCFQILGVALAIPGEQIKFYAWSEQNSDALDQARSIIRQYASQGYTLVAHNVFFEATILRRKWDTTFNNYFDTMAYLQHYAIEASLRNGSLFYGHRKEIPPEFNRSSLLDPTSREQMARYAATDVALSKMLFEKAVSDPLFSDLEFFLVGQTTRINLEGLNIDTTRIEEVVHSLKNRRDKALSELSLEYIFDTSTLNSHVKVKKFIGTHLGVRIDSLDKRRPELKKLRASNKDLNHFLDLRDKIRLSEKYIKFLKKLAHKKKVYGFLRYFGAHTGRFSSGGRDAGRFNLHSLPKGNAIVPETSEIRSIIIPDQGKCFVAADLANIEARIVAFLAGENELLEQFRQGTDVYCWFAGLAFPGVKVVKGGENTHLRKVAKSAILGLGFGMGLERFLKTLKTEIPDFDEELGFRIFNQYQSFFPRIKMLRKNLWSSFLKCLKSGVTWETAQCTFQVFPNQPNQEGNTLVVTLPTGRPLLYRSILTTKEVMPWGLTDQYWYTESFGIEANRSRMKKHILGKTRKFNDGRFRTQIYSQILVENVTQAIARDLMMGQIREIEMFEGLTASFHIHDEVVVENDACQCGQGLKKGKHNENCPWVQAYRKVEERLSKVPDCYPKLAGLPVACEVNPNIRHRYR